MASKWCSLVFPREFLDRYQTLSSCDDTDLNSSLDETTYSKFCFQRSSTLNEKMNRSNAATGTTSKSPEIDQNFYACSKLYDSGKSGYVSTPLVVDNLTRPPKPPKRPRDTAHSKKAKPNFVKLIQNSPQCSSTLAASPSYLEDISADLTNFELLSLNTAKEVRHPTLPLHSKSPKLDYGLKNDTKTTLTSCSSSSTNSIYSSGDDLSEI